MKPAIKSRIKEQKVALIQEEILEVAAKLIAQRGFSAVTSDDISAEMGFTKSIIYYYFRNKNEILWKIFEKIDSTYSTSLDEAFRIQGGPEEIIRGVIRMHCFNVLSHGGWATIYNRDDHELTEDQRRIVSGNKRRYTKRIEALYESGVKQGRFKKISPVIAVACLIGACNWGYTWYKPTGPMSAEEIADAFADQLTGGILT
jgi:AcrR family transcriptional regulator